MAASAKPKLFQGRPVKTRPRSHSEHPKTAANVKIREAWADQKNRDMTQAKAVKSASTAGRPKMPKGIKRAN